MLDWANGTAYDYESLKGICYFHNKPGISDPEGKTILNDLVLKGTHQNVFL